MKMLSHEMSYEHLFKSTPVQADQNYGTTTGPIAEYIQNDFHSDLAMVVEDHDTYPDLASRHARLLSGAAARVLAHNRDPEVAEITQLDLLFMLGAYLPLEDDAFRAAPPELLSALAANKAQFGTPDRMAYEQIIDINTAEFIKSGYMRTYLSGAVGRDERDFYLGHFLSEPHIKSAFLSVNRVVTMPDCVDTVATLRHAAGEMAEFTEGMNTYRHLSSDSFTKLRSFLKGYPDGTRNASGAFMPSVQLLELALHEPTEQYDKFIDESMPYFPRNTRGAMQTLRQDSSNGINLIQKLEAGEITVTGELKEAFNGIADYFLGFRLRHYGMTQKHIPKAYWKTNDDGEFSQDEAGRRVRKSATTLSEARDIVNERDIMEVDSTPGSAGFNIPHVLGNSVVRLDQLKERIGRL
jgi:hypothetical protein